MYKYYEEIADLKEKSYQVGADIQMALDRLLLLEQRWREMLTWIWEDDFACKEDFYNTCELFNFTNEEMEQIKKDYD